MDLAQGFSGRAGDGGRVEGFRFLFASWTEGVEMLVLVGVLSSQVAGTRSHLVYVGGRELGQAHERVGFVGDGVIVGVHRTVLFPCRHQLFVDEDKGLAGGGGIW